MRLSVLALTLLVTLATSPVRAVEAPSGARVVVPVSAVVLPGGWVRLTVPVSVGSGPPMTAMLDTGSVGLRLMPGAVDPGLYRATGRATRAAFGSGVGLDGVLARAGLHIGDADTGEVTIQVTERAHCLHGRDNCPADHAAPDAFRIGGGGAPGEGFAAILGLGLRPNAADNPLARTATGSWILLAPRPGDGRPGELIINPTLEDRAGFALIQLPARDTPVGRGWMDTDLPACLSWAGGPAPLCGGALLDTGTPEMAITSDSLTRTWRPGDAAHLAFGDAALGLGVDFQFGQSSGARLNIRPPAPGRQRRGLNTGLLPYYSFAVLYDARSGTIGLKRRAAP